VKHLRLLLLTLSALLAGLSLLGCGNSSDTSDATIEVRAENTRFVPDTIQVPAGKLVTLVLKNLDANEHDLEVRGVTPVNVSDGGHEGHGAPLSIKPLAVHAEARKSAKVTFQIDEKGTYEVFCSIPGHEQSGMVAKLVVV
jgi:uncharacterized cupredoxin-like copper-binding protein